MLPGRAWVPEQFDAGSSQFYDGRWQVADGKADHWSGAEVFPARVLAAEDLDMAAIAKLEDPQVRLGAGRCEAKHALIEMPVLRQLMSASLTSQGPGRGGCTLASRPVRRPFG